MPSLFTWLKTGPMMNRLRNSDSPASTWFGGTVVRPSALRVSDSTTKILVKLVTINRTEGATDSTVTSSRMLTDWLGLVPRLTPMVSCGGETVGDAGADGATGAVGSAATGWATAAATGPSASAVAGADCADDPKTMNSTASRATSRPPRLRSVI